MLSETLAIADNLRGQGLNVDLDLNASGKFGKYIQKAKTRGIPYTAIVGPEDVKKGMLKFKDLRTQTEFEKPIAGVGMELRYLDGLGPKQ